MVICPKNMGHGHAFNRPFGGTYKCQWCGMLQSELQERDTIQQQAERIRELERQRDKFYGEANIEREAAATYKLVLDQLVEILGEIPYGDIVGTVALREQQLSEVVEYATKLREALPVAEQVIDILWVSHHANRGDAALEALRGCLALPLPKAMQP